MPSINEKVLVCGGEVEVPVCSAMSTPAYGDFAFECDVFSDEMGREPEIREVEYWAYYPIPKQTKQTPP